MGILQAVGGEEKYGNQDTDGSRSTRHHLLPLRQVGAAARTMLETTATARWKVPVAGVHAANHEVVHPSSGRRLGYGDLATDAAALPVPDPAALRFKNEKDYRYVGRGQIAVPDLFDITTGRPTASAFSTPETVTHGSRVGLGSPACHRLPRRCATRSSLPSISLSATCRSASNSESEAQPRHAACSSRRA